MLVQGDTGPGNFMYSRDECRRSSTGSWRTWATRWTTSPGCPCGPRRIHSPTSRAAAEYEALTGNEIDEQRVRYYQVMAEAKLQVMSHRGPTAEEDDTVAERRRWRRQGCRQRLHLPGPPPSAVARGAGRRHLPRPDAGRGAARLETRRPRVDVPRRPRTASRRGGAPHHGSTGPGARARAGPDHQVLGPSRCLRSLL